MKPPTPPPKRNFQFDPKKYAHHVAEMDLTDEQRDQVIQVVANIMRAIVGLGFGVSPAQTPCGEDDILGDLIPKVMPDLIDWKHTKTTDTQALTGMFARAELEES